MRAWTFQDSRQKKKLGIRTPWSVAWYDGVGKRRSKRVGSKSMAEKYRRKVEGELAAGLLRTGPKQVTWETFVSEYRELVMRKWRSYGSRLASERSLQIFKEIVKPKYVCHIDGKMLDTFVAKRITMRGKRPGDSISPETVRKDVRTIRAALRYSVKWNYLERVPENPRIEGYGKDKPFVTEQHFDAMMAHCNAARLPKDQHYEAKDFWRALLAMAWVTGMRRSALISVLWEDVDLDAGGVLSRYRDNKAKRDQRHRIGPALPLLRGLYAVRRPGENRMFPWGHALKSLDRDLARIQKAAGIHLPCREDHEHTDACHHYGFHGFRYAHATYNFGRVSDRELQEQMGHASFNTTQRYIKYAASHQGREYDVYVPASLKSAAT